MMQDGQITRVHQVGSPYEEDLKAFRDSGVGQAILSEDDALLDHMDRDEREALRQILQEIE
jgi:hypothetical protein